jgi:hypothetical protein
LLREIIFSLAEMVLAGLIEPALSVCSRLWPALLPITVLATATRRRARHGNVRTLPLRSTGAMIGGGCLP